MERGANNKFTGPFRAAENKKVGTCSKELRVGDLEGWDAMSDWKIGSSAVISKQVNRISWNGGKKRSMTSITCSLTKQKNSEGMPFSWEPGRTESSTLPVKRLR